MTNDDDLGRIRNLHVRLIDEDGASLGIVLTKHALEMARERGLELIVMQPEANPPVARLIDYARYKFEQSKRFREARRKQHNSGVKEFKMRYQIEHHDYRTKLTKVRNTLLYGDRVKVLIALRGREIVHADLAFVLMKRISEDLNQLARVDKPPTLEGKCISMVLVPISAN